MKKLSILFCIFLMGCASTKYYVRGEQASKIVNPQEQLVIVENTQTRSSFLESIENWLDENGFSYTIVSQRPTDVPYLRYEGRWSWDFTVFLSQGFISLYSGNKMVSRCKIDAPNNLNFSKFDKSENKIDIMMNLLFYHDNKNNVNVVYEDKE
ncbi:MAG: hypothetical protein J5601_05300 [Elusimicrobiaceae bacterium]|nr:hypothetical protein [Elusimicrobiaceae bacterium]